MSGYLLPTDQEFIDFVAKKIARTRWDRDVTKALGQMIGESLKRLPTNALDDAKDRVFDSLWNGTTDNDAEQRDAYRIEAEAVISAINLKLLISPS